MTGRVLWLAAAALSACGPGYRTDTVARAEAFPAFGGAATLSYPRLVGGDPAVRERVNADIGAAVGAAVADFAGSQSGDPADAPSLDLGAGAVYVGPDVLSFGLGWTVSSMGMAHPYHDGTTLTYSLRDGRRLGLADVFRDDTDALGFLSQFAYHDLSRQLLERRGTAAYGGIDAAGVAGVEESFRLFTLSADSIHFDFPPYAVASYADGGFTVGVPLAALHGHLRRDGPVGAFADSLGPP